MFSSHRFRIWLNPNVSEQKPTTCILHPELTITKISNFSRATMLFNFPLRHETEENLFFSPNSYELFSMNSYHSFVSSH